MKFQTIFFYNKQFLLSPYLPRHHLFRCPPSPVLQRPKKQKTKDLTFLEKTDTNLECFLIAVAYHAFTCTCVVLTLDVIVMLQYTDYRINVPTMQ